MQNVLPESVSELRTMVMEAHRKWEGSEQEKQRIEKENDILREQVRLLRQRLFGRKSEKYEISPEEMKLLFPEWQEEEKTEEAPREEVKVEAHTRTRTGRKPIPDDLPRIRIEHDLPDEEKVCACGAELSRIGEEVSEQLDIIPARYQVIQHVRYKYACKCCQGVESDEGAVKIAPVPERMLPKSLASSRLLAQVMTSKFCDALPFYRQENVFARTGIDIGRASMCNWALALYERCRPLEELLLIDALSGPVAGMDETPVLVLDEQEKPNKKKGKSYMWVIRGGPPGGPGIVYHFSPSRSAEVAKTLLDGYQGVVQTDGYTGYDFLDTKDGIVHVGCWAHVRRKFMETIQAAGGRHGNGKADEAIRMIRSLYEIEKETADKSPDKIVAIRQERSRPVLDRFEQWLKDHAALVPPKSQLGQAMQYALSEWPKLVKYIENGHIRIDNNLTENAIRPFVVGRKNWLFSKSPEGAKASAFFYSIVETAKANGLEPFSYLTALFERYPLAKTVDEIKVLLPQYIDKANIAEYHRNNRKKSNRQGGVD